jgi:hypothetical protein
MSYWDHLVMNVNQALVWLTYSETWEDVEFERKTNSSWKVFFHRCNRWTSFRKKQRMEIAV